MKFVGNSRENTCNLYELVEDLDSGSKLNYEIPRKRSAIDFGNPGELSESEIVR